MKGTITIFLLLLGAQTMAQAVPSVPKLPPITGDSVICAGASTALTDAIHGGTWSSSNTAVATIGSATGVLTGVSGGTATITFDISGVIRTTVVTINPLPAAGTITGAGAVCTGASVTLSDAIVGGVWSSGAASVASISATGSVTGTSPGTAIISYIVTNSCGSAAATRVITVNTAPAAGVISGITALCDGATAPLTDAAPGGVWHSSNSLIAAASPTGIVTGVAAGVATISYTVTNSCGSAIATTTVSVGGSSSAGTISGPSAVYVSATIALTDPAGGGSGTWAASNANATVSATGIVTGIANGTVTISYTVISSCGAVTTTKLITVSHAAVSPISAYALTMCTGDTLAFWDWTTGGTWAMSPASVATVSPVSGVVTAISAGTATLSYTYGGTMVTTVVTVNPSPAPITGGLDSLCVGSSMMLYDATTGGVWSSGLPSKATVTATGSVTCTNHSELNVPIYYTMPNGCRATFIFVTDSMPGLLYGPTYKVCAGSSITLIDTSRNGYWSGSNAYATVNGSGDVTGVTAGTAAISFTLSTTGCYRVMVITVNPLPATISGSLTVCTGSYTILTDATTPTVSWLSSSPAVASASFSGAITGVSPGTTIITFTATNGCIRTAVLTVNPAPAVAPIMGPSTVSHSGGPVTLSDATPGGVWVSTNPSILSVGSSTGIVTATGFGSTYIDYVVTNSFGCSVTVAKFIGTSPAPPHHGGTATTTVGETVNIADEAAGGEWISNDNSVATVDADGIVTGMNPGSANITHTVLTSNGDQSVTVTQIVVNPVPFEVTMFPNPNNGSFTVRGTIASGKDEEVVIEVTDITGERFYLSTLIASSGIINEELQLGFSLDSGVYILIVKSKSETKALRFVVEK